jgi:hypothetical protein
VNGQEGEVLKVLRGATTLRAAGTALIAVVAAGVVAASALAVVNGKPDGNAHPYVGAAVSPQTGALCSGSLLSATVFVTAGHCFADGSMVLVDVQESLANDNLATAVPGIVHIPQSFGAVGNGLSGSDRNDFAVVTLLGDGLSVDRYAKLPAAGYDDTLPKNQQVDIVGYGVQDPHSNVAGTRLSAQAKIIAGGGQRVPEDLLQPRPGRRDLLRRLRRPRPAGRHRHDPCHQLVRRERHLQRRRLLTAPGHGCGTELPVAVRVLALDPGAIAAASAKSGRRGRFPD